MFSRRNISQCCTPVETYWHQNIVSYSIRISFIKHRNKTTTFLMLMDIQWRMFPNTVLSIFKFYFEIDIKWAYTLKQKHLNYLCRYNNTCITSTFWFCFRRISHKVYNRCIGLTNWILSIDLLFVSIKTYLSGTKLRSPSLKLSDRCKHVYAVAHVDLLYTVKHDTEDTAQWRAVPVWKYQCQLVTLIRSQKILLHDFKIAKYFFTL